MEVLYVTRTSPDLQYLRTKVAVALAGSALSYSLHFIAAPTPDVAKVASAQSLSEPPQPKVHKLGALSDLWSRTQKSVLLTMWRMNHDLSWIGRFAARCRLSCSCCRRDRRQQTFNTRSRFRSQGHPEAVVVSFATEVSHLVDMASSPEPDEESALADKPIKSSLHDADEPINADEVVQDEVVTEEVVGCSLPSTPMDMAVNDSTAPSDSPAEDETSAADEASAFFAGTHAELLESEDAVDPMTCSWTNAFDAGTTVSDLEVYVQHFCPIGQGFSPAAAESLADFGTKLWRTCPASPCAYPSPVGMQTIEGLLCTVHADPARAASAFVWALMRQALCESKGFEQGTFVVHGPGVEEVFFTLLPHTYDRNSSHFAKSVMWLTSQDIERFPFAEAAIDIEARMVKGSSHVGIDVPVDGVRDLPAGKQHVVLGRIRQHDGSVSLYVKPEEHGFELSAGKMGEAALHAASYITSQVQRRFGDRRAHDEGELKRKEYVPIQDKARFDELLMELQSGGSGASRVKLEDAEEVTWAAGEFPVRDRVRRYGLGEMARTLRAAVAASSAGPHRDEALELLQKWEKIHGPWLDFQRGREVLIHTSCFAT